MKPQTPVTLSPYRKGVCWHGVKPDKLGASRWCGVPCGRYRVTRPTREGDAPGFLFSAEMWLCTKHAKLMERKGYVLVTLPE